jgi:hypothetical protein
VYVVRVCVCVCVCLRVSACVCQCMCACVLCVRGGGCRQLYNTIPCPSCARDRALTNCPRLRVLRGRNLRVMEDIFFAVYYGLEDLGLDAIWVRCQDLGEGCATDAALGSRQVRACGGFETCGTFALSTV